MHFATERLPDDGLQGPRQVSGPTPIVLALPWGGVPVAAEVARALDAPVDLILVRKIGVPYQPELAMGAVVDGSRPLVVRNADVTRRRRTTNFRAIGIYYAGFGQVSDKEVTDTLARFPVRSSGALKASTV